MVTPEEVINTINYGKYVIKDSIIQDDKCWKCGKGAKNVQNMVGTCSSLVAEELQRSISLGKTVWQRLENTTC